MKNMQQQILEELKKSNAHQARLEEQEELLKKKQAKRAVWAVVIMLVLGYCAFDLALAFKEAWKEADMEIWRQENGYED